MKKNWKYIVIVILAIAGAVIFWFVGDFALKNAQLATAKDWFEFRIGFPFIGLMVGVTIGLMNLKI